MTMTTHTPAYTAAEFQLLVRLGGWLLPVSLTGNGVTTGGRTSSPTRVVGTIDLY